MHGGQIRERGRTVVLVELPDGRCPSSDYIDRLHDVDASLSKAKVRELMTYLVRIEEEFELLPGEAVEILPGKLVEILCCGDHRVAVVLPDSQVVYVLSIFAHTEFDVAREDMVELLKMVP